MRRVLTFTALLIAVAAAGAQGVAAQSIDPGMTKSQVIERLGAPHTERSAGAYTYLFYQNGVEYEAGMSDLVILQNDSVIDAIFRSGRQYTGKSSSPEGVVPANSAPAGERLTMPASPDTERSP
jgi:hypothetical protein